MKTTIASIVIALATITSSAFAERRSYENADSTDELAQTIDAKDVETTEGLEEIKDDGGAEGVDPADYDLYTSGAAGDGCYCPNYCTKGTEGVDGVCRVRKLSGRFLTKCAGGTSTPTCAW